MRATERETSKMHKRSNRRHPSVRIRLQPSFPTVSLPKTGLWRASQSDPKKIEILLLATSQRGEQQNETGRATLFFVMLAPFLGSTVHKTSYRKTTGTTAIPIPEALQQTRKNIYKQPNKLQIADILFRRSQKPHSIHAPTLSFSAIGSKPDRFA